MSDQDTNSFQDFDEEEEQDIVTLSLINCVKEREWLYTRSDERHNDKELVARSWREISEIIDMPPDAAKVRWTRLRNSYTKALARRLPRPGLKPLTKPWIYETEMDFLKNHLKLIRKKMGLGHTTFNYKPIKKYHNNKSLINSMNSATNLTSSSSPPSEIMTSSSSSPSCAMMMREQIRRNHQILEGTRCPVETDATTETVLFPERPKKPKLDEFEDIMVQYARSLKDTRAEEPLVGWFRTLLPTIKTFPPHHLVDFQINVMQEMKKLASLVEQEKTNNSLK